MQRLKRQWRPRILAALILCAVTGGAAGYAIATHGGNVSVLTGTFYVGDRQASGSVDGWTYGVTDSVPWLDASNAWHDSGWPTCLGPVGTAHTVRFGYTTVDGPTAVSWRQVVWVSCTS